MRAKFNVEACMGMTETEFVKAHTCLHVPENIPKSEYVEKLKEFYKANIKPLRDKKGNK